MDKPQKPTDLLPSSFGGEKEAFSDDKIANGYQPDVPDILGGANLNYTLDAIGKNFEYNNAISDFIVDMPINNVVTVDQNNKLTYREFPEGVADSSLSNLTPEGEKHFLNKTQITNCVTEIPQRIKYTLENGVLTVKAGSVVIIPYGTEDLTAQYPVGSTFINDNFKVYDTQFDNDKFFVWVEFVEDRKVYIPASVTSEISNTSVIGLSDGANPPNFFWGVHDTASVSVRPETNPTRSTIYYNTTTNKIEVYRSSNNTWMTEDLEGIPFPFPFISFGISAEQKVTSINQVFNGIGYIGSVVWVDKDVKGLIPNGRNDDGTCKNISFTTEQLCIGNNLGHGQNAPVFITKNPIGILDTNGISRAYQYFEQDIAPDVTVPFVVVWYNTLDNLLYLLWKNQNINDWTPVEFLILGSANFDSANFKIEKFKPKKVFQAADAQNLDGQWVCKAIALTKLQTLDIGTNIKISYDLSSYLPNDGYTYEVMFSLDFTTSAASGASFNCSMISSINNQDMWLRMAAAQTRATTTVIGAGNAILPIGLTRIVIFNYIAAVGAPIVSIYAEGYRRLGY